MAFVIDSPCRQESWQKMTADRVDEALPHLKRLPYLRLVAVSTSDNDSRKEVDRAVKRIGQAIPGLEDIMIEMSIHDEQASHSGGFNVQQSLDFLLDINRWPALLLIQRS